MFNAFTGEAMQGLKAGNSYEEVRKTLWKTYAEVWETKKATALQETVSTIQATRTLKVQQPIQSATRIQPDPLNNLFAIPWKKTPGKIRSVDAGRRVLRRRESAKHLLMTK